MGLIWDNKCFLHLTTWAPRSIHDARLLRHSTLFQEISRGNVISNKGTHLGDAGEILFVMVGDLMFPWLRLQWLIKRFNENTCDQKERYFNRKLCSARVVLENPFEMLKECWWLLCKKSVCEFYNAKYVIMVAVLLHNICIYKNDPCKPSWRLDVEHLVFVNDGTLQPESIDSKRQNIEISQKISEWLWNYD